MQKTIRVISFQITSRAHSPGPFENHRDAKEEEGKLVLPSYVARERIYSYVSRDFPCSADLLNVRLSFAARSNTSKVGWLHIGIFIYVKSNAYRHSSSSCPTFSYINIIYYPFWHIQICSWKYAFVFRFFKYSQEFQKS